MANSAKTKQTSNTSKTNFSSLGIQLSSSGSGTSPHILTQHGVSFQREEAEAEPNWHSQKGSFSPNPTENLRESSLKTPSRALESLQGRGGAANKPRPQKEKETKRKLRAVQESIQNLSSREQVGVLEMTRAKSRA